MQAIVTRYIGPANVKGSRVKAIASAGTLTIPWDDALSADQNHCLVARLLAHKFGWLNGGPWTCGGLPNSNDRVWVQPNRETRIGHDIFEV